MWVFSILMFFIFIIMGITTGLTPLFSRQATPFGVAVAGKHTFVEKQKKRFALWNVSASVVLGLPLFLIPFMEDAERAEWASAIYVTAGMGVFLFFSFILYLKFRSNILKWKQSLPEVEQKKAKRVVVDMNYHQKLKAKSHATFFIWQLAIILIPVILAFAFYDRIPEEIPIHWDSQFEVTRTISKSIWGILALPGIQVLMIPVFNYSNHAIVRSKQRLSPLDPKEASEKSRRFREAWSNFTFGITIATQLLLSSLFLYSLFSQARFNWFLITVIILYLLFTVGGTLYLTLKYGQAGEKLLEEEEQYYEDPDEESQWVYGIFYYNKEDPSVFVEKRFGIGSTLNLARWQSWLVVVGIVLFIVLTIVWSITLT
ncbi:DUF1648 domain-containing protein [Alkalibacterium iburiense]|uniref:DUF1648 domain-containing protein n=1 Tax=Alkalibacterium iburiense TaxID=290589 RepID=A0ABN0XAU5_9LACT